MRINELLFGFYVVVTFGLTGCGKMPKAYTADLSISPLTESPTLRPTIKNTIGVVTPVFYRNDFHHKSESSNEELQIFRLYNFDGSLWLEFLGGSETFGLVDFRPYGLNSYGMFELNCMRIDSTNFEVIVNEATRLRKYIKRNDPDFQFQGWEEHILSMSSIDFDVSLNPPRKHPDGNATSIEYPDYTIFIPVKIQGDWLYGRLQEYTGSGKIGRLKGMGWIKWKVDDQVVVHQSIGC